jgi:hypothetical protein
MIREQYPYVRGWSNRWFSPKFHGPALRYEIALSILGGDIVWINGPFLPGLINDVGIFKDKGLKDELDENERVEADDGYIGQDPQFVRSRSGPVHPPLFRPMRNTVRARHETVNARIKNFRILCVPFRSSINKHWIAFEAVVVIVQLGLKENPLFTVADIYKDY